MTLSIQLTQNVCREYFCKLQSINEIHEISLTKVFYYILLGANTMLAISFLELMHDQHIFACYTQFCA